MNSIESKIKIDYTYYLGKDLYSDGFIEEYLLDICKKDKIEEALFGSSDWAILYHLSDIRENIIDWYPISKDDDVLEIGSGCGAITGALSRKAKSVTCIELSEKRSLINAYRNRECDNVTIILGNFEDVEIKKKYDIITLIGVWEYSGLYISSENPYVQMLSLLKKYLKDDGQIIIAIENKMGIKYWNGAMEDHTGQAFCGLKDYIGKKNVRTFSKQEIEDMLNQVGFKQYQFYYPMGDYKLPNVIYSDYKMPKPGDLRYFRCDYSDPRIYIFNEATVCDQLCRDKMFSYFSNSFLITCGTNKQEVIYAKYNRDRKREFAISTLIINDNGVKKVIKEAIYPEAIMHISNIKTREIKLFHSMKNVTFSKGKIIDNKYVVDFLDGENINSVLFPLRNDKDKLIQKISYIMDIIFEIEEEDLTDFVINDDFFTVFGDIVPLNTKCLKVSNVDMIFDNMILYGNRIYCFDNEWVFDFPVPINFIKWRMLIDFYVKYTVYLKNHFDIMEFIRYFGIDTDEFQIYQNMEKKFHEYVYGKNEFYLERYKKNAIICNVQWV